MIVDPHTRRILQFDAVLGHVARRAHSAPGADAVRALEPVSGGAAVRERLEPVRELVRLMERNSVLPLQGLEGVLDIFDEALVRGSAVAHDRWPRMASFLAVCGRVRRFGGEVAETAPIIAIQCDGVFENPELHQKIERMFENRGGVLLPELRDDASDALRSLRRDIRRGEQGILKLVGRLVSDLAARGLLQESYSTVRGGRHVLPVRASARSRVTGIIHGSSGSGETVFIEPAELVEQTNLIEELKQRAAEEEWRILRLLTDDLREWASLGRISAHQLTQLDAEQAVARTAYEAGWHFPLVDDRAPLRLLMVHHPLLHLERRAESVPIMVSLGSGDRVIVFSGPNAGGKTTAMKTIALTTLMVQSGLPAPLSPDSTVPVFDGVFADIGDSQDLSSGLSTFSGHIRRIVSILDGLTGTERALVLLDELGTGTDPKEGSVLAVSLLEELLRRSALTVTTSHYEAVKDWAARTGGVRNASFSLDGTTRRPTFRVRLDLPGASEALEIARNEGMPAAILSRAAELLGPQHLRMGELLRGIEERERTLAGLQRDAEAREATLREHEAVAAARMEQLREERRAARQALLEERERVLAEAREKIERLVATLPGETDIATRRERVIDARREIVGDHQRAVRERAQHERAGERRPGELRRGMRVFVRTLGEYAEVLDPRPGQPRVLLVMGSMQVEADRQEVLEDSPVLRIQREAIERRALASRRLEPSPQARQKPSRKLKAALKSDAIDDELALPSMRRPGPKFTESRVPAMRAATDIDLHGRRVEEAVAMVDKHIDNALLASLPHIRICHGTGAGRLYRAIHEFLRSHPSVRSFRFGTPDEGGGGVTIANL